MNQPIQKFDSSLFNKVPLYKSIFNPFLPLGFNNKIAYNNSNIEYLNLKISLNSEGVCQYIYGYNQQVLDVICCVKNMRYRFILPCSQHNGSIVNPNNKQNINQKHSEIKLIKIKNKLLVIIYKTHIFIHDLVRHNNRLVVEGVDSKQLIQGNKKGINIIGICSLNINQHYIYRIISNNLTKPLICLQLFNIDMTNNLNVILVFSKIIRITEKQTNIINVCAIQSNYKLVFCVLVEQNGYNRMLSVFQFIKQSLQQNSININKSNVRIYKLGQNEQIYGIHRYQADELLINTSKAMSSKINAIQSRADSWIVDRYSQKLNVNQQQISTKSLHILCNINYYLIYSVNQRDFILIKSNINQQFGVNTKIIQHEYPIVNILLSQHKIYVLDENFNIWQYQLNKQQVQLSQPKLFSKISNNKQKLQQQLQYQLLQVNQKIIIITKLKIFTLHSPLLFDKLSTQTQTVQNNVKKYKIHNNSIPTFLSIQSQNYTSVQVLFDKIQKQYQKYGEYLSLTMNSLYLNITKEIVNKILWIQNTFLFRFDCPFIRQYQIWNILLAIVNILNKLKNEIQGSIYDCSQNQYYWLLSNIISYQRTQLDIKIVISSMVKNMSNIDILQTLLSQLQVKNYLASKCQNIYNVTCITYFGSCKLQVGCSCPFKRLLFLIMKRRQTKIKTNFMTHQKINMHNKIENIILSNELREDKLQDIISVQENKIKKIMQNQYRSVIRNIDEKWDKEFPNSKDSKMLTDTSFKIIKQQKNENILIITYLKPQSQLNKLYERMGSEIAQKLLGVKFQMEQNMLSQTNQKYFQKIYRICKQNQLLYCHSKKKNTIKQISTINSQQKIKLCIIAASQAYQQYIKQIDNNLAYKNNDENQLSRTQFSNNMSISQQDMSLMIGKQIIKCNIYRKYWILISQLICSALSCKYTQADKHKQFKSQLQNLLTIFMKSMGNAKYFPNLVTHLKKVVSFNIVLREQMKCLVQCILKTEMYRFNDYIDGKAISAFKFRYSQQVWTQGIQKLTVMTEDYKQQQI